MKIVVLAGGMSMERDVSLSGGTKICRALRQRGHRAVLVDMFMGLEDYSGSLEDIFDAPDGLCTDCAVAEREPDLAAVRAARRDRSDSLFGRNVLRVCAEADIVFLALHGACGEDGRVQAAFDLLGIPYTGSGYLGSALAMDKGLTKRLVAALVPTAAWREYRYTEADIPRIAAETELPCVIKPNANGSSIGVSIVRDAAALTDALRECLTLGGDILIEQYLRGREMTVCILAGQTLPPIEIIPKQGFYDYANKYQPGASDEVCPADIPAQWEQRLCEATVQVYEALGLSVYARADFIVTADGTPYFLEMNTLPGMTPTSLVPQMAQKAGLDYAALCERIVEESLRIRGRKRERT